MKRLFLLIAVCMIGIVLPQGMWADYHYSTNDGTPSTLTIDVVGSTVTITSQQAGALWALLEKGTEEDKNAVINAIKAVTGEGSEIVFSGVFSGDDLQSLYKPGSNNCCVQETVDMANTTFKKHTDLTDAMDAYLVNTQHLHGHQNASASEKLNFKVKELQKQGFSLADGDIGVHEGAFYKYNSSTNEWTATEQPFFQNPDRLPICINTGQAYGKYAGAMDGGQPAIYQSNGGSWVKINSGAAYDEMTFGYWGSYVKTAITSNNVGPTDRLSPNMFSGCTELVNITLGSGTFDFKIGNASDFTKIENIVVKKDVVQLGSVGSDGDGFFPSSSSLKTVTFETGGTTPLKLGKSCFNGCTKIESVTIPARTQLIEQYAFGGTDQSKLAVVKFNDDANVTYPMVIKHEAFNNQKHITDVWVDINPDVRPLVCEYEAFDFDTMDGQTTPTKPMAKLHFNKDYWDYYAGNWKKGMSLDHLDLGKIRDGDGFVSGGATITKGTNSQLVNQTTSEAILGSQSSDLLKTGQIKDKRPANGWQQFARTDTGIDIIIEKGKDFRTYSTEVALVKPDWMHIYRVTNFDDGFKENSDASSREEADAAHKVATTQEIVVGVEGVANCIPMNTGVIRVDNVTNDAIYYIMEWKDLKSAGIEYDDSWEYPYVDDNTKTKVNFMKPTSTPDSNPEFTIIGPVEKNGSGEITHRVFGLKKVQKDNGITGEFLRAKVNTKMARNRAYLSLPKDLFHWQDENTSSTQPATGTIPANSTNNSKISLIIDADFDLGFNNGIATSIQHVIEEDMYKNDSFYTLQGVKVAKPTTKGVYIHNGKKILIK